MNILYILIKLKLKLYIPKNRSLYTFYKIRRYIIKYATQSYFRN